MNENIDPKIKRLTEDLAAVISESGVHYQGVFTALHILIRYYRKTGIAYLNTANIKDIVSKGKG